MNEVQQLTLLKVKPLQSPKRPVEYLPPTPKTIDQYVHAVCRELTQKENRNYLDTDFVRGLTTFMNVIVRIQARYLNRGVKHV
jgi:hypothetical protein